MGVGYLPDPETFLRTLPRAEPVLRKGMIWIDTVRPWAPLVKRRHRDGWHRVKGRKARLVLRKWRERVSNDRT